MKTHTLFTLTAALLVSLASTSQAATPVIENGTTTPTISGDNVGSFFGYNGGDYDGDNGFAGGAAPGQTFLTPNTAAAFTLNSVTLQESNGSGPSDADLEGITFQLGIFSVSGNTLTSLGLESYTFGNTLPGDGGYFTFDTSALNLTLNGNTEYAFTFEKAPNSAYGYFGLVSSAYGNTSGTGNDTYAGGMAISADVPTGAGGTETINTPTANGTPYDRAFEVGLTAQSVPEPSTYALLGVGALFLGWLARRKNAIA